MRGHAAYLLVFSLCHESSVGRSREDIGTIFDTINRVNIAVTAGKQLTINHSVPTRWGETLGAVIPEEGHHLGL